MNKKSFLAVVGVTLLLLVVAFNVNRSQDNIAFADLTLENIEALAQNEGGGGKPCTVITYIEYRYQGCLYSAARCAEGHIQLLHLIHCNAR